VLSRIGFEREAHRIQDLYLAGKRHDAAAVVPTRAIEQLLSIGPA
jgi:hypothetical protein